MKKMNFRLNSGATLFVTRIILAVIFIFAGWLKVSNLGPTILSFSQLGIPGFLTTIVAYGEFIGGILLLLGLFVEVTAIFLSVIMIVAAYLTLSAGPMAFGFPLATLAALIALTGNGAGSFAVKLPKKLQ